MLLCNYISYGNVALCTMYAHEWVREKLLKFDYCLENLIQIAV